jgi:hypothetical protein
MRPRSGVRQELSPKGSPSRGVPQAGFDRGVLKWGHQSLSPKGGGPLVESLMGSQPRRGPSTWVPKGHPTKEGPPRVVLQAGSPNWDPNGVLQVGYHLGVPTKGCSQIGCHQVGSTKRGPPRVVPKGGSSKGVQKGGSPKGDQTGGSAKLGPTIGVTQEWSLKWVPQGGVPRRVTNGGPQRESLKMFPPRGSPQGASP